MIVSPPLLLIPIESFCWGLIWYLAVPHSDLHTISAKAIAIIGIIPCDNGWHGSKGFSNLVEPAKDKEIRWRRGRLKASPQHSPRLQTTSAAGLMRPMIAVSLHPFPPKSADPKAPN